MPEEIIKTYGLLPQKIQSTIDRAQGSGSQVVLAIRTEFRVNADMPYCYLVVMWNRLMVCSSHKTRGVHHSFAMHQINAVDTVGKAIRILPNEADDVVLPIDATPETLKELIETIRKLKASA